MAKTPQGAPARAPRTLYRGPASCPHKSPVRYTQALADTILERIGAGEHWEHICKEDGMPSHRAPYNWCAEDPEFRQAWKVAMRAGADARAVKVLDIAEAATNETLAVDRFRAGSLRWHVVRDDKVYGPVDEPDEGAGRHIVIEVRQFQRVERADGSAFMREILPSGEVIDLG